MMMIYIFIFQKLPCMSIVRSSHCVICIGSNAVVYQLQDIRYIAWSYRVALDTVTNPAEPYHGTGS